MHWPHLASARLPLDVFLRWRANNAQHDVQWVTGVSAPHFKRRLCHKHSASGSHNAAATRTHMLHCHNASDGQRTHGRLTTQYTGGAGEEHQTASAASNGGRLRHAQQLRHHTPRRPHVDARIVAAVVVQRQFRRSGTHRKHGRSSAPRHHDATTSHDKPRRATTSHDKPRHDKQGHLTGTTASQCVWTAFAAAAQGRSEWGLSTCRHRHSRPRGLARNPPAAATP